MPLSHIFKVPIILILFTLFIIIFGYPAFKKFVSGGIVIEQGKKYMKEMESPAITICMIHPETKFGWREFDFNPKESVLINGPCNVSDDLKSLISCIETNTFAKNETIKSAVNGKMVDLKNTYLWVELLDFFPLGRCHSIKPPSGTIGFSQMNPLKMSFNSSLEYRVTIHDPDFYVMTSNPQTFPRIMFKMDQNFGQKWMYLEVTKHIKLNTKNQPCKENKGYSFKKCIKIFVATKIGCKSKWDNFSNLPECKTTKKLVEYEKENHKIHFMEQTEMIEYTGCLLPCTYLEFKLIENPIDGFQKETGVWLMYGSGNVLIKK